jgi:hypothetical protein
MESNTLTRELLRRRDELINFRLQPQARSLFIRVPLAIAHEPETTGHGPLIVAH